MDDPSSINEKNVKKRIDDNFEGAGADMKREEDTRWTSNGVEWLKERIAAFNDKTQNGEVEEILKLDTEIEIFKAIINPRKIKLLRHLTENDQNFIANVSLDLWKELIILSAEKEFFEIYVELRKFEKNYERKFYIESSKRIKFDLDFEYKNVLDDISELHAFIDDGEISKIIKFIAKYPKLKLCYGSSEICALERTIDARQFHIYAFLRAKGFYSDKGHEMSEKIENLSVTDKEKIRDEISKFTISDPEAFTSLVLTKCELDAKSSELSFSEIREMLQSLSQIEEIRPILEILALSDVKIIFDYKSEFVTEVDPSANEYFMGYSYFREGILYVGKNQSRTQRFGTFAHEATHFALYLLYENSCLPYRDEDEERERVWENVVRRIKEIYEIDTHGTDDIIKRVFDLYHGGYEQKTELIVRANHLLAFYSENPQKCEEVQGNYRELFEFYRDLVLPDLKMKNYKIIKLNNDFELFEEVKNSNFQVKNSENFHFLDFIENDQKTFESLGEKEMKNYSELHQNFYSKNYLLLSDVPQMTLSKLFQEISKKSSNKLEAKVKNLFINFERLQQENLRKELEETLKNAEILRLVFHFKINENQSEKGIEERLKLLKFLNFSGQILLVACSESENFLKGIQKTFKVENSKVEIEDKSLKFIEKSTKFESSQSSLKFLKVDLKNFWDDLTKKSQKEILKLKIKFQDENFPISSLFDGNLSSKTLSFLSSQEKLEVKMKETKEMKFYFEPKFLNFKKLKEYFIQDLEEISSKDSESEINEGEVNTFDKNSGSLKSCSDDSGFSDSESDCSNSLTLNEIIDRNLSSKVVLISEISGSGKTTLLHKIHQNLNEKFQNFWICFVSLLENKKILLDRREISENFLDLMTDKIFNLSEIERKIFELKYERNEVVILFDGFDEILPDCKRNAMKIFKLHKQREKSQIWITTRTHLEKDLEEELQVKAHKIKPLNELEQVEFLCKFWEESCVDSDLRKKCAKKLVEKINEMDCGLSGLICIPFYLQMLGEFFKEIFYEDFDDKMKNLSLFRVCEFLIRRSIKFNEQNSAHDISNLHSKIYEVLALKRWTKDSEKYKNVSNHLFGSALIIEDLDDRELEELSRGGIIFYDQNGEIFFLHRTVEKYFVWLFAFKRIKNFKKNWQFEEEFCEFFFELLNSQEMVCFNECFKDFSKNFEKSKNFALNFHNFVVKKFIECIGDSFDSFSKISYSLFFALKAIKLASPETFKKMIESNNRKYSKIYFLSFICKVQDQKFCEEFLEEVFELLAGDKIFYEFFVRKNQEDQTIFLQIINEKHSKLEVLKNFFKNLPCDEHFLPYRENDENEIKSDCKGSYQAELIVRANDIHAFFHKNQKSAEVRETFRQLFDFHPDFVSDLNLKNAFKIIKLNYDFELFEETKSSKFQVKHSENLHLLEFEENVKKFLNDLKSDNSNEELETDFKLLLNLQNEELKNFLLLSDVPQMTFSKIFNEISKKSLSKLDVKIKNIFVNFEYLLRDDERLALEKVIESAEILRVIVHVTEELGEKNLKGFKEFMDFLNRHSVKVFLVVSSKFVSSIKILNKIISIEDTRIEVDNEKFKACDDFLKTRKNFQTNLKFILLRIKHSWNNLTEISKEKILNTEMKFRCKNIRLKSILNLDIMPSVSMLNILSSSKNIQLEPEKPKKLPTFVPRTLIGKDCLNTNEIENSKYFEIDDFFAHIKCEKVVLISDIFGSGKTTFLRKIHQTLFENYPDYWISFVSLREHKDFLSDQLELCDNFLHMMTEKILKLNEIERKFFEMKYEKNEVVILFDGFNKISPDCKRNVMKIFKLHKQSGKSQIWITTRPHLEHDLEQKLKVETHYLKPLSDQEQITFLCNYWKSYASNFELVEKCARALQQKVLQINHNTFDIIGIVLQLQILAEHFKDKLTNDFDERIKNLNLYKCYKVLFENFKDDSFEQKHYEALTLKYFIGNGHHLFGNSSLIDRLIVEKLEEFERHGIIYFDQDKNVFFNHLSYGEFLISCFIRNKIQNFQKSWEYELDFMSILIQILTDEKFNVVRMFLHDSFEEILDKEMNTEQIKNFAESFLNYVSLNNNETFNWVTRSVNHGISNFVLFMLKTLKRDKSTIFKIVIDNLFRKVSFVTDTFLIISVFNKSYPKALEEFLDDIFELYPENLELFEFLMLKDITNRTIFHEMVRKKNFKNESLKIFWKKIEKRKFEDEKFLEILLDRDNKGKCFVDYAFKTANDNDEIIDTLLKMIQSSVEVQNQKKIFKRMKVLELIKEKDLRKVLTFMIEKVDLFEVLKLQKSNLSIVDKIFEINERNFEIFEYLMRRDVNGFTCFHKFAQDKNVNVKVFLKICSKVDFEYEKVSKIFFAKDKSGKMFFHYAIEAQSDEKLHTSIDLIKKFLKIEDRRKFFEEFKFYNFGNLRNFKDFKIVLDLMNKIFSCHEALEHFSTENEEGKAIWHIAAENSTPDVLQIILDEYQKLSEENLKSFIFKKDKHGRNVLMTVKKFENFAFIWKVLLNHANFKELIFEVDENGFNILHFILHHGNLEMLEHFLNQARIEFSNQEFKSFLKIRTKKHENIFHLLTVKSSKENIKFVEFCIEYFSIIFTASEIKELLTEFNYSGKIPLYQISYNCNEEIFKKIFEFYIKFFTKAEILSLINLKDETGKNRLKLSDKLTEVVFNILRQDRVIEITENFDLYPDNSELFEILIQKGFEGRTIFHEMVQDPNLTFEAFGEIWNKIEARNFDYEEILSFFFIKNMWGKIFFYDAIFNSDKNEEIEKILTLIRRNVQIEDQRIIFKEIKFYELGYLKSEQTLMNILEFMHEIFSADEIINQLMTEDKDGNNFWHYAARYSSQEVLKIIFEEFTKLGFHEILEKSLLKKNTHGLNSLKIATDSENLTFIFNGIYSKILPFHKFIFEVDNNGFGIYHYLKELENPEWNFQDRPCE